MSFLTDLLDYDINFATLVDSSSKSVCDKNENAAHVKSSDKIICGSSNSEIFQNFRLSKKSFFPNFSVSLPQNVTLTSKLPGVGDLKDIKSLLIKKFVSRCIELIQFLFIYFSKMSFFFGKRQIIIFGIYCSFIHALQTTELQ